MRVGDHERYARICALLKSEGPMLIDKSELGRILEREYKMEIKYEAMRDILVTIMRREHPIPLLIETGMINHLELP